MDQEFQTRAVNAIEDWLPTSPSLLVNRTAPERSSEIINGLECPAMGHSNPLPK